MRDRFPCVSFVQRKEIFFSELDIEGYRHFENYNKNGPCLNEKERTLKDVKSITMNFCHCLNGNYLRKFSLPLKNCDLALTYNTQML